MEGEWTEDYEEGKESNLLSMEQFEITEMDNEDDTVYPSKCRASGCSPDNEDDTVYPSKCRVSGYSPDNAT